MATTQRLAIFPWLYEMYVSTVDPNAVISPQKLGATCFNQTNGHLYQCTTLPSTWTDYDPSSGSFGWVVNGTVISSTPITYEIAMGRTTMLGAEKTVIEQVDAVTNGATAAAAFSHATSGAAATGMGVSLDLYAQNSIAAQVRIGQFTAYYTDVTSTTEDSALAFSTMAAGVLARAWTIGAIVGRPGDLTPFTDSSTNVGTALLRLGTVFANTHSVYLSAGDTNPTARLSSGALALGTNSGAGLAWSLTANAVNTLRVDMPSGATIDSTGAGGGYECRVAIGDTNAGAFLQPTALSLGAGGATALDTRITRSGTKTMTFDDANGGNTATFGFLGALTVQTVASGTSVTVGGKATATTADSAAQTGTGPNAYNLNNIIPANTLTLGRTVRISGCVRSLGINGTDTTTITVKVGATTYLTSAADVAAIGDICVFNLLLTARAAVGAAASVTGFGSSQFSTAAAPSVPGHNTANLATNGALTVSVNVAYSSASGTNSSTLESLVVDYV